VDKVLRWLDEEGGVAGLTVADCGCGTGSLAIPLALRVRAGQGGVGWARRWGPCRKRGVTG
jgi:ubiquinone/menaquinone biosynthesis C-methylase UbiE